jgi:MFS family permease
MSTSAAPSVPADSIAPTPAGTGVRSWRYAVGLLTVVYTLNFLDRQIVNILAEPIKRDLHLADWQVGVLTGLAFALIYTVCAVPVARYAERSNRPRVIAGALTVWTTFTAVCGLAQGFWHLAAARLMVGLGESGCAPAAHSLITEYAPPQKRAQAFGWFNAGLPVGSLIGLALGGVIADRFGWRAAFFVAGLPGILVAVLVWTTLVETRRAGGKIAPPPPPTRFWSDAKALLGKRAYPLFVLGGGLISMRGYGVAAFMASFFFREHAAGLKSAAAWVSATTGQHFGAAAILGPSLAIMIGLTGLVGTLLGGVVMDRMARRDVGYYSLVPALPHIAAAPFWIAGLFWPDIWGAVALLAVAYFLTAVSVAPIWTAIQCLSPISCRATASAIGLLVTVLLGLGVGPVLVGAISDIAQSMGMTSGDALRIALLMGEIPALLGAVALLFARRHIDAELETR